MNNRSRVVCAVGCVLLGVGVNAFTSEEAHRLYEERYRKSPPSVQECGDYLFVIVEGTVDKGSRGDATKQILAAQMAALEQYVGCGIFGYVSPFGNRLTERLRPKGGFEITSCPVVTVEEDVGEKRFREVSAFAAGPIKAERRRMLQKKPSRRSVDAWARDLAVLLEKCPSAEVRVRVMSEAGLSIPLLFAPEYSLRCVGIAVDGSAVEKLFGEWGDQDKTQSACEAALRVLPTFSPAHRRLAELAREKKDFVSAVDEWIKAGIAGTVDDVALNSALDGLASSSGAESWREFAEIRRACLKANLSGGEGSEGLQGIGDCVRRSFGRAEFSDNADAEAQRLFQRATEMFRQGKDLPGIIRLLERSLARNPGNADAWRLYGDALRTDKRWPAAALAYHQALSIHSRDCEAVYGAARCYEAMGGRCLARAAAWWGVLSSSDEALRGEFSKMLRRLYPDVFL